MGCCLGSSDLRGVYCSDRGPDGESTDVLPAAVSPFDDDWDADLECTTFLRIAERPIAVDRDRDYAVQAEMAVGGQPLRRSRPERKGPGLRAHVHRGQSSSALSQTSHPLTQTSGAAASTVVTLTYSSNIHHR